MSKHHKNPRKIKLPLDRTGTAINIGDILEFSDGTRLRVDVLNWYGGDFWTAEDTETGEYSDNLGASFIWRWRK